MPKEAKKRNTLIPQTGMVTVYHVPIAVIQTAIGLAGSEKKRISYYSDGSAIVWNNPAQRKLMSGDRS